MFSIFDLYVANYEISDMQIESLFRFMVESNITLNDLQNMFKKLELLRPDIVESCSTIFIDYKRSQNLKTAPVVFKKIAYIPVSV